MQENFKISAIQSETRSTVGWGLQAQLSLEANQTERGAKSVRVFKYHTSNEADFATVASFSCCIESLGELGRANYMVKGLPFNTRLRW